MKRIAGWASLIASIFVFLFAILRAIDNPSGIFALLMVFLSIVIVLFRKKNGRRFFRCWRQLSQKQLLFIQIAAHIISFSLMILVAVFGEVEFSWDWGEVITSATNLTVHNVNLRAVYFLRYPNNQFWLAVITGIFKVIYKLGRNFFPFSTSLFKWISIALAILMMRIAFVFLFFYMKERWHEKTAMIADAAFVVFLPSIMYSGFAYTDVPAFMLLSAALFLSGRCLNRKAVIWQILFALVSAILYRVKTIGMIAVFAIIVAYLFSDEKALDKLKTAGRFLIIFVICASIIMLPVNALIGVDQSDADAYEFPVWHWVAMALQQNGIYSGGYSAEDVKYTNGFPNKSAKTIADINLLKERLAKLGAKETAEVILWWKPLRAYGSPFLMADDYISRKPVHPQSFVERILGAKGDLHHIATFVAWIQYYILLVGMVFACISRRNSAPSAGGICILVMVCFFFIWEVNPRYLFLFVPLYEILAVDGWRSFLKRAQISSASGEYHPK